MTSTTYVDAAVRPLRVKALVYALCELSGCEPNGPSLSHCWALHHRVHNEQPTRMWNAFFNGRTPSEKMREQMYSDFPTLRVLFDNPLWLALSDGSTHGQEWDYLSDGIRVGGQPLEAFNNSASLLLFSRVDWPCFGLLMMLLQTRSPKFLLHRKWLMLNFSTLCCLACLQAPLAAVRREVYGLLTSLLSQEPFNLSMFRNWPTSTARFEAVLADFRFFHDLIKAQGWLDGSDTQSALLLWIFLGQDEGLAVLCDVNERRASIWPSRVRQLWNWHKKQWINAPVTLGDYYFPVPV